jgi:hypothetical protein
VPVRTPPWQSPPANHQSHHAQRLRPARFTRTRGWDTGWSNKPGTPGEQTFTWASTSGFEDSPFSAPPIQTLKAMAPSDLMVEVFLWRPRPQDAGGVIRTPVLPITIDGSAAGEDYPGAVPERWFQRFTGSVGDRQLDVWVFAGQRHPSRGQVVRLQTLINSLKVPTWPPKRP